MEVQRRLHTYAKDSRISSTIVNAWARSDLSTSAASCILFKTSHVVACPLAGRGP